MRTLVGLILVALPVLCQPRTPFTITEVTRRINAPDQPVRESRFLFAMNRDGSIASVELGPESDGTRQIVDLVNHRSVLVNRGSRTAVIMPNGSRPQFGSPDACEQRFRSMPGAVVSVERSAGKIQGVALQRISVSLPGGAAMEILVAPSLACHMIETYTIKNGTVVTAQFMESLQLGHPDPALFVVPTDYQVTELGLSRK